MAGRQSMVHDSSSRIWMNIGQNQLKFTKFYTNLPSLNLRHVVHFASCPFSGPIVLVQSKSDTSWVVSIRTSGGLELKDKMNIPDVFFMEWTYGHRMLVIDRRGKASVYSALGECLSYFSFDAVIKEVRDAVVFQTTHDSGVAIMDDQQRLFVVNSVNEPVVWGMHNPCREQPTAWTVFQPVLQLTRLIIIFGRDFYLGCQGEQLGIVDTNWALTDGQYARIVVDKTRTKLAVYHFSRTIQVVDADLSTELLRIPVPGQHAIFKFGWIGTEALFLQATPTFLQVFSATSKATCYEKQTEITQIGVEDDGLKLYTNNGVEFLSIVSKDEADVLGVASNADGALLNEAAQFLQEGKSHQAYEYVMQVRDLGQAIDSCITTATYCWSSNMQKELLKAAKFGMAFTTGFETKKFTKVLRDLRILNEIRGKRVGLCLTYEQFERMKPSCLLNRLIDIGCYGIAIEMCKWLGQEFEEGIDRVLLEWVRRTITNAAREKNVYEMDMEFLDHKIAKKLEQFPHISIADAAEKVIEAKLPKLARLLIKRETDDSKQVKVLLQLGDVQEALNRAAAAQKPQLLHQVVRHLMATSKKAEYELVIRKIPLAQCLYQELVRQDAGAKPGRQMLALLEQGSDFERQTLYHLDCASAEFNPNERLNALRNAKTSAHSMGDKLIEELISDMAAFAPSQTERGFDNLTIRETVIAFAADFQKVERLKHQAKLTDKQVWLWTIEGLAREGKMDQLIVMSQKKSPVGYVPFIKACMKYNRASECNKFFPKVTGYNDLIAAHLAMKNFLGAAKMAFDRRDRDMLQFVYTKSHNNKEALSQVGQLLRSL